MKKLNFFYFAEAFLFLSIVLIFKGDIFSRLIFGAIFILPVALFLVVFLHFKFPKMKRALIFQYLLIVISLVAASMTWALLTSPLVGSFG